MQPQQFELDASLSKVVLPQLERALYSLFQFLLAIGQGMKGSGVNTFNNH